MTDFTIERLGPHLKYHPLYRDGYDKAVCVLKLAEAILPYLGSIFKLPSQITFKVGLIKRKGGNAQWYNKWRLCLIDPRRVKSPSDFVNSILHEMTHAEQYHLGVLEVKRLNNEWVDHWNDQPYNSAYTHKAYESRPWEVEARQKSAHYAAVVTERMLQAAKTQLWDDKFTLIGHLPSDLKRKRPLRQNLNGFSIGDVVTFDARGQKWVGKISQCNKKTCTVKTSTKIWQVYTHLLRKS